MVGLAGSCLSLGGATRLRARTLVCHNPTYLCNAYDLAKPMCLKLESEYDNRQRADRMSKKESSKVL